jgi:hypothetical protein
MCGVHQMNVTCVHVYCASEGDTMANHPASTPVCTDRHSVDTAADRTVAVSQQQLTIAWQMHMRSDFSYHVVADACGYSMKQLYRLRRRLGIRTRAHCTFGQALTLLYVVRTELRISQRGIPYELQRMADLVDLRAGTIAYVGLMQDSMMNWHHVQDVQTALHADNVQVLVLAHLPTLATLLVSAQAQAYCALSEQQAGTS